MNIVDAIYKLCEYITEVIECSNECPLWNNCHHGYFEDLFESSVKELKE